MNKSKGSKSFEDWSQGKTMHHALSSDMSSRLKDLLHDLTATDLLSTAFPAFVQEERVEHLPTMDVVEGEQGVGTINPVPELIEEETSQDYLLRSLRASPVPSESPHWCETFAPSVWSCSSQGFDQPSSFS